MTRFANLTVPRVVAEFVGSGVQYSRSYPKTDDSMAAVANWLLDYPGEPDDGCWRFGGEYRGRGAEDQRVTAVARRLLFWRQVFEARFLESGGRLP